MKLLLDTHAFLFAIGDPTQLSDAARRSLLKTSNQRFVSVVSFWEIAIKTQIGKLDLPTDVGFYEEHLRRLSAVVLPVEARHTFELLRLPMIHKDPFDRLLVAQARVDGLTVLSRDEFIAQYEVRVLW
jgi:PIN domain nuclease of toxin-antitoxin system